MTSITMLRKKVTKEPAVTTVAVYYKVERVTGRLMGYATLSAAEARGLSQRYPAYEWVIEAEWLRREG
jgi:hypothetical protein